MIKPSDNTLPAWSSDDLLGSPPGPETAKSMQGLVEIAVGILDADKGTLQLYDDDKRILKMVSQVGFKEASLEKFESSQDRFSRSEACADFLPTTSEKAHRGTLEPIALPAGTVAVQAVPIVTQKGKDIGRLSVFFGVETRFSYGQWALLERCARHAAELTEGRETETAVRAVADADTLAVLGGKRRCLYIEDNPADVELFRLALAETLLDCDLTVLQDGSELLSFMRTEGKSLDATVADLIVIDLHLSAASGQDILRAVKANRRLASVPIVILSSELSRATIASMDRSQVERYITKPTDLDDYLKIGVLLKELLKMERAKGWWVDVTFSSLASRKVAAPDLTRPIPNIGENDPTGTLGQALSQCGPPQLEQHSDRRKSVFSQLHDFVFGSLSLARPASSDINHTDFDR